MAYLIGNETAGSVSGISYIFGGIYQCQYSGILDEFRLYTLAAFPGYAKAAVYNYGSDDTATGSRISVNNTETYCTDGQWNSITMPEAAVVAGNYYWLCVFPSTYGVIAAINGGTDYRETSTPYSSGLPAIITWDSDFSYTLSYAGYGALSGMSPMMMRTL